MKSALLQVIVRRSSAAAAFNVLLLAPVLAQTTQRANVNSAGVQGNFGSAYGPSITPDGRYIAFTDASTNLVPGDTNSHTDTFIRDRQTGITDRVSVSSTGVQGNFSSIHSPSISADGRYVAFSSEATNLVAGDTNNQVDIFVRDRQSSSTDRVSIGLSGVQSNGPCAWPSVSADGRYVAFESSATSLIPGANGNFHIFVRDRQTASTECVSIDSFGVQGNNHSIHCSISADGRYVAFASYASNLVSGDTNGTWDVFTHDRQTGVTARVSVNTSGTQGNDGSSEPGISPDGRYVVFSSSATNLIAGDTNGLSDIFLRDRQGGVTQIVSLDSSGVQCNGGCLWPSISADARYVAFSSAATNLGIGDTNGVYDIFIRDRDSGATDRVSIDSASAQASDASYSPVLSAGGSCIAFASSAPNLVAGDTNGADDIFVRDRAAVGIASICVPGVDGVMLCPCANPPEWLWRGCENSSYTGGGILAGSGSATLSSDSLSFTAACLRPNASSTTTWQGPALLTAGTQMGQGVRCVTGSLKRLYNKPASPTGVVQAPTGGDPSVSARSAFLGDPIAPGQHRYYFVSYRDPAVLGSCSPLATFNVTQALDVLWAP